MRSRREFSPLKTRSALLLLSLLLSASLRAEEKRIAIVVEGKFAGQATEAEQKMAAQSLEGILQTALKDAFGVADFDQDALEKARAQKESWSVISGGTVEETQKALREARLDALVRARYRVGPGYRFNHEGNTIHTSTANVTIEVIDIQSGEKGALVWSPPMGALDTGATTTQHPAKQGQDAHDAGMAALRYATGQAVDRLKKDPVARHLLGGGPLPDNEGAEPLRALFLVDGTINGDSIDPAEQRVGAARLEAVLGEKLRSALGLRSFDDALLQQAKQDAEAWAVLNGDDVGKVQEVLDRMNIDVAVRIYFRTAPAYRKTDATGNAIYSGTANVNAQIISKKTGEKGEVVVSPAMGTTEHPARRALDAFDASMAALDYASDRMLEQFKASPMVRRLRQPEAATETGAAEAEKVIFVLAGSMGGEHISDIDQRVGSMSLETMLSKKLSAALGLRNFDEATLASIRSNAEQWAVLMGGGTDEVQAVLDKHNVDRIVRVDYATTPRFHQKDKDGNAIYYATAKVHAVVLNRAGDGNPQLIKGPTMGNAEHMAKSALDPYDAGMSALDYATDRMAEALAAKRGELSMMTGTTETTETTETTQPATQPEATVPGKPTVAVLWVKPTFGYWSIPRARQPGLNRRKRTKMKSFVDHVKKTGNIGVEVAYFLVQGLAASGALVPVENSGKAQSEIAQVQNKLLEYRMAGWVKGDLPISDPVVANREIGADYVVTANITKIWEEISKMSGPFVSKGRQAGFAECELTITNTRTGASQTYKGTGSMGKSGYGTFTQFDPANMALDRMMIGGAIKEALYNAAKQVRP